MKKSFKEGALKLILSGTALFAFGIFVGYQLNSNSISSIQGFLFNALTDATDSNATDSNATDSNATNPNATDPNATNANATSANAQITDNILFIDVFALETTSAKPGENVYLDFRTCGASNISASIVFVNTDNGVSFSVPVDFNEKTPYVVLPTNISAATYSISDLLLVGLNSDGTTFTKQYSSSSTKANVSAFHFGSKLTVVEDATKAPAKTILNSISLDVPEAKINDKVNIKFNSTTELSSLKLSFINEHSKEMVVYVKSLTTNPYFEIPSTTEVGTYNLVSATLISSVSTTIYSKDGSIANSEKFAFNSAITVKENAVKDNTTNNTKDNATNNFVYNNEDLTENIIKDLYNAEETSTFNINADSNPIINLDLFNAIKGTSKKVIINYNDNQIIFNGENINNAKSIDVTVNTSVIKADSDIGNLVNDGILLDFASNGELPGTARVRIKITDDMKTKLGTGKIYVYYYNESCEDFSEIATEVTATPDGYYEFDIEHNSEYILVNKTLDSELVAEDTSNIVSFQKSDKINLLLIGLGVLVVVGVTIGILVLKKKKNTTLTKK